MQINKPIKSPGFTLLEMLLSLILIIFITGISYLIFRHVCYQHKVTTERVILTKELHNLTEIMSNDLSCAVFIDKGFSIFEVYTKDDLIEIALFSTNNPEHITKVIRFVLSDAKSESKKLTKYELSYSDSLFLQNTLKNKNSINNIFTQYIPEKTTVLCSKLFDFKIRLAIKTPSGGIFFTPPNASLAYKDGILFYKIAGTSLNVRGVPLFIDITARALTLSANQEFSSLKNKSNANQHDFLTSNLCKSFRRIVFKAHHF